MDKPRQTARERRKIENDIEPWIVKILDKNLPNKSIEEIKRDVSVWAKEAK